MDLYDKNYFCDFQIENQKNQKFANHDDVAVGYEIKSEHIQSPAVKSQIENSKLVSQYYQSYQSEMADIKDADVDKHIRKCLQNEISMIEHKISLIGKYIISDKSLNFRCEQPFIIAQSHKINGTIINYEIMMGNFKLYLKLLNFKEIPTQLQQKGQGGYGAIFKINNISSKPIIVKRILFKDPNNKKLIRTIIQEVILQYSFNKICSFFQIGPKTVSDLGFDLVCTEKYIEFYLEQCQVSQKSFYKNIEKYQKDMRFNLKVLHRLHIIHKDVKPMNIFYSPEYNKFVFGDFGISEVVKQQIGQLTQTYRQGTPNFMLSQMKQLQDGKGYIDLYYNDLRGLIMTFGDIKKLNQKYEIKEYWARNFQRKKRKIVEKNLFYKFIKIFFHLAKLQFQQCSEIYNKIKYGQQQISEYFCVVLDTYHAKKIMQKFHIQVQKFPGSNCINLYSLLQNLITNKQIYERPVIHHAFLSRIYQMNSNLLTFKNQFYKIDQYNQINKIQEEYYLYNFECEKEVTHYQKIKKLGYKSNQVTAKKSHSIYYYKQLQYKQNPKLRGLYKQNLCQIFILNIDQPNFLIECREIIEKLTELNQFGTNNFQIQFFTKILSFLEGKETKIKDFLNLHFNIKQKNKYQISMTLNLLFKIIYQYKCQQDFFPFLEQCSSYISTSQDKEFDIIQGEIYHVISMILLMNCNYQGSLKNALSCNQILKKDPEKYGNNLFSNYILMHQIYKYKQDSDHCIQCLDKCTQISIQFYGTSNIRTLLSKLLKIQFLVLFKGLNHSIQNCQKLLMTYQSIYFDEIYQIYFHMILKNCYALTNNQNKFIKHHSRIEHLVKYFRLQKRCFTILGSYDLSNSCDKIQYCMSNLSDSKQKSSTTTQKQQEQNIISKIGLIKIKKQDSNIKQFQQYIEDLKNIEALNVNQFQKLRILQLLASYYHRNINYIKSLQYLIQTLQIFKKIKLSNEHFQSKIIIPILQIFNHQNSLQQKMIKFQQQNRLILNFIQCYIAKQSSNNVYQINHTKFYEKIGDYFIKINQFQRAIDYFQKILLIESINISKQVKNKLLSSIYQKIFICILNIEVNQNFTELTKKVLLNNIRNKDYRQKNLIVWLKYISILLQKNKYTEALIYLQKIETQIIYLKQSNVSVLEKFYYLIILAYQKSNKNAFALGYLQKMINNIQIIHYMNPDSLRNIYHKISILYIKQNQFDKSIVLVPKIINLINYQQEQIKISLKLNYLLQYCQIFVEVNEFTYLTYLLQQSKILDSEYKILSLQNLIQICLIKIIICNESYEKQHKFIIKKQLENMYEMVKQISSFDKIITIFSKYKSCRTTRNYLIQILKIIWQHERQVALQQQIILIYSTIENKTIQDQINLIKIKLYLRNYPNLQLDILLKKYQKFESSKLQIKIDNSFNSTINHTQTILSIQSLKILEKQGKDSMLLEEMSHSRYINSQFISEESYYIGRLYFVNKIKIKKIIKQAALKKISKNQQNQNYYSNLILKLSIQNNNKSKNIYSLIKFQKSSKIFKESNNSTVCLTITIQNQMEDKITSEICTNVYSFVMVVKKFKNIYFKDLLIDKCWSQKLNKYLQHLLVKKFEYKKIKNITNASKQKKNQNQQQIISNLTKIKKLCYVYRRFFKNSHLQLDNTKKQLLVLAQSNI